MIHEAITKAVKTNKLEPICTAQEVLDTAKHLGKKWDMNAFCEKYAMPPQIAADLLQVSACCGDMQNFVVRSDLLHCFLINKCNVTRRSAFPV